MRGLILLVFIVQSYVGFAQSNFSELKSEFLAFRQAGNQDSALLTAKRMHRLAHKEYGDSNYWFALSSLNIGKLYYKDGELDSAQKYVQLSLNGLDLLETRDLWQCYSYLGAIHSDRGDLNNSLKHHLNALYSLNKNDESDSILYANSFSNIGGIYLKKLLYEKGELYFRKAYNIKKNNPNVSSKDLSLTINNLGVLYMHKNNLDDALILFSKAYDLIDDYDIEALSILENIRTIHLRKKEFYNWEIITEKLNNKYLEIIDHKASIVLKNDYAIFVYNTGNYYFTNNKFNEAANFYIKTGNISRDYTEYMSEVHRKSKVRLGLCFYMNGSYEKALEQFKSVFELKKEFYFDNFNWLTDDELESNWRSGQFFYNQLPNLCMKSNSKLPEFYNLAYDATLLNRSRLLELYKNRIQQIDKSQIDLLARHKYYLDSLERLGDFGSIEFTKEFRIVDSLQGYIETLWPTYNQDRASVDLTWQEIFNSMKKGQCAIEFIRFQNTARREYQYAALVIGSDNEHVEFVPLCTEYEIDKILRDKHPGEAGREFYKLIWEPLEEYIVDYNEIYYSPIGILSDIPFHSITTGTNENGPVFTSDNYKLHRCITTRVLVNQKKQNQAWNAESKILLVGGVDFYSLPKTERSKRRKLIQFAFNRGGDTRGDSLHELPATEIEINEIGKVLLQKNWYVESLKSSFATEERVLGSIQSIQPEFIHIATHGFYFDNKTIMDFEGYIDEIDSFNYRYGDDPLDRSGLILAGGNYAWTGNDTLNQMGFLDGLLTANETKELKLQNTKLVVLSACQSGLGENDVVEGTLGILRSLKLAGADQVLVSLWKIPDSKTADFMISFYKALIDTENIEEAYFKAQNQMRLKFSNPSDWAGFVLVN